MKVATKIIISIVMFVITVAIEVYINEHINAKLFRVLLNTFMIAIFSYILYEKIRKKKSK